MPALFPMMAAPEDFQVGDHVRKFVSERSVTPFLGVVTHVVPSTYKVWVQWPTENAQESPETLIKVNPMSGLPMATMPRDQGYGSYEKQVSEKLRGFVPKMAKSKMAIRIAHTFATGVIGDLAEDILDAHNQGLSSAQAYYRTYPKYANKCSDHIIRYTIQKIYKG